MVKNEELHLNDGGCDEEGGVEKAKAHNKSLQFPPVGDELTRTAVPVSYGWNRPALPPAPAVEMDNWRLKTEKEEM